jgi:hypothetical protein
VLERVCALQLVSGTLHQQILVKKNKSILKRLMRSNAQMGEQEGIMCIGFWF